MIIFGEGGLTGTTALYRVSADGGVPAKLIEVNAVAGEERLTFPYFLPDGRRFLYLARSAQRERSAVYLASLDAGEKKRILTVNSRVVYSAPGHLLFARSGTLMAQPFDLRRGETTGDAFPVDQVAGSATLGTGAFSVSDEGALAFAEGGGGLTTRLTWFDRTGQQLSVIDGAGFSAYPWLSPDGQRLAVARSSVDANIWLIDLLRPTHSPLTLQGGNTPVWSPDGKTVVFVATRNNKQGLYQKAADGTGNEELLVENAQAAMDWSSDGRFILFRRDNNGRDVWALDMGAERKASPVLEMKFNEDAARISPDGRWITYSSDESGRPQIYVQQFPPSEGKWAVSKEGAVFPRWRTDGRELLYQTLDNEIVAVEVKLESMFEPGARHVLFKIPGEVVNGRWAATPDAQRFLFPLPGAGGPPITVLTNWIATVKK